MASRIREPGDKFTPPGAGDTPAFRKFREENADKIEAASKKERATLYLYLAITVGGGALTQLLRNPELADLISALF